MSDRRGISGKAQGRLGHPQGTVPFVYQVTMTASNSPQALGPQQLEFPIRVIQAWGIMTGAGAAADTVVLNKVSGGTTSAITNTADVSAFSDTDQFDFSQINDANYRAAKGDRLSVTTVSGALCQVYALCVRVGD